MLQDGWQALFAPHILRRGKEYWQTRYPRRSAMLDEIRKLQKRVRRRNTASL